MRVGKVQDDRRAVAAAPVAWVEVAVHHGVGQAAVVQHLPPALQAPRGAQLIGAQLGADRAVEQVTDGGGQGLRAAVGETARRLADAGLRGRQAMYRIDDDRRGRVPAVRAGNVG